MIKIMYMHTLNRKSGSLYTALSYSAKCSHDHLHTVWLCRITSAYTNIYIAYEGTREVFFVAQIRPRSLEDGGLWEKKGGCRGEKRMRGRK